MAGQFKKTCGRGCGKEIIMQQTPEGWKALNPDFTPHQCGNSNGQRQPAGDKKPEPIIGLLTGYNSGSATFRVKSGATKTYALHGETFKAWQTAGVGPDQWVEFSVDDKGFIQHGARNVPQPDWGDKLKDPTNGEVKTPPPQKKAEPPKQEEKKDCTSSGTPAAAEPATHSDEDTIRAAMMRLVPSERVGFRISLAGMVNSVIEIKKSHGKPIDTEEVKREAVALFLWCDGLTTQNIPRNGGA